MNNQEHTSPLTLGGKIKDARKRSGITQEQLSERLGLSRQAITKWESDKGMPDIDNLKLLSKALNVSLDYLLDDGTPLNMNVLREPINLDNYAYKPTFSGRWLKKTGKKDMVVQEKYPNGTIHMLLAQQINTKSEKLIDNLLGFLTDAPFGIPQIINGFKNAHKEYYLVDQKNQQFLVTVTDEIIESRQLFSPITQKNFVIGQYKFTICGKLQ